MSYRFHEPDIDKLQRIIGPQRFVELLAYERINPRGEWREDGRMARLCATVANSSGFRTGPAAREADFLWDFGHDYRPQQTVREMKEVGQRLAAMGEFD